MPVMLVACVSETMRMAVMIVVMWFSRTMDPPGQIG